VRRPLKYAVGSLVIVVSVTTGVSAQARSGPNEHRHPPVPGASWPTATPAQVGLDASKLQQIAATAEQGKSNCLAVVRHGKLAGEWYFNGTGPDTAQQVFSVTKSVTSTLVGIAQDDGDLRIRRSAARYIPQWRGTPAAAVTIRDLLSNDSGRQWSTTIDYDQLIRSPDQTAFATGLAQQHRPGTVWAYNNSAIQTLQPVLAKATGREVTAFAQERLFGPLQMAHTRMATDLAGNAQTYAGVTSTCRDLARFGLLMLRHGRWGARPIVSRSWVAQATGRSSTPMNAAYGYLWWLNRYGVVSDPLSETTLETARDPNTPRSRLVPGAPRNTFWAIGLGNQVVQVDPGTDTVVVRLGTAEILPQPPTFGPAQASRVITEAVVRP
jgi:CubicO group peptidase (beta-lactamase class C family)